MLSLLRVVVGAAASYYGLVLSYPFFAAFRLALIDMFVVEGSAAALARFSARSYFFNFAILRVVLKV